MMKVVSVINYKGGVGKTTLTANLGAYAAVKGKRVLMVDLDPQTHLTFSFMTPEQWRASYADTMTLLNYFEHIAKEDNNIFPLASLTIPLRLGDVMRLNNWKLDLICSHLKMLDMDAVLAGLLSAPTPQTMAARHLKMYSYLRNELDKVKDDYDLVLIDCPPSFHIMVKNAITASDYYIVPAKLDYLSTLGVSELETKINDYLDEYHQYTHILGDGKYKPIFLSMLGIVPMMVNIHKGEEPVTVEREYMNLLKQKHHIYHFIRNNSTVFGSAPKDGVPAVLTRPRFNLTAKKIVRELQELGEEFLRSIDA